MGKSIIAKMVVSEVTRRPRGYDPNLEKEEGPKFSETVKFSAVYDDEGPNKEWAMWTPSGTLELTIDNPPAQGVFNPGEEVFVTIAKAEEHSHGQQGTG